MGIFDRKPLCIPALSPYPSNSKGPFTHMDHTEALIRLMKSIEMYGFSIIEFLLLTIVKEYVSSWENRKYC